MRLLADQKHFQQTTSRLGMSNRTVIAFIAVAIIVSLFVLHLLQGEGLPRATITLSANPSAALASRLSPQALPFEKALTQSIQQRGHITATVHVALLERQGDGRKQSFADGNNPRNNLYWGALFGMETYFANRKGWSRVFTDYGDGVRTIRRVVFHHRVRLTPDWRARGVTRDFDFYLLANAWPNSRVIEAMEQPLRDALCTDEVVLRVGDNTLRFGGASVLVGYVGQNHMLDEYWDPFAQLPGCTATRQAGIFYLCPRSAVVLHLPVIEHGLYPVLFTRAALTPEAYLVEGIMQSLISGRLGDDFLSQPAAEYSHYQKTVSRSVAESMLIR